jgi:VWFA-related protein
VETAAVTFARASNPLDEVFVVNFSDKPRIDVPMTGDVSVLEAGIARIDSIGGTAMRDAVDVAEAYLTGHATHDRRALLLITDGHDNASAVSADRISRRAEQSGIALYAIGLPQSDSRQATRGGGDLDDLAERTGGFAVHVAEIKDVEPAAVRLARCIRQQYTLAYTPLNQALDGSYRKIRVAVKGRQPLSAHTRTGYYATAAVR